MPAFGAGMGPFVAGTDPVVAGMAPWVAPMGPLVILGPIVVGISPCADEVGARAVGGEKRAPPIAPTPDPERQLPACNRGSVVKGRML